MSASRVGFISRGVHVVAGLTLFYSFAETSKSGILEKQLVLPETRLIL
jgi:hypothetical protein